MMSKVIRRGGYENVVNLAALHDVERCEIEQDKAFSVNAVGAGNVARLCAETGAHVLYVSTDYVFSGCSEVPYAEFMTPCPVNVYGVSKYAGEQMVRAASANSCVLRSGALFGRTPPAGKQSNFVDAVIRKATNGEPIFAVNDQTMTPTGTRFLALQMVEVMSRKLRGVVHATCQGFCTWCEFASEVLRMAKIKGTVNPVMTLEYAEKVGASVQPQLRVKRPKYSVLENGVLQSLSCDVMPTWRTSLFDYLHSLGLT